MITAPAKTELEIAYGFVRTIRHTLRNNHADRYARLPEEITSDKSAAATTFALTARMSPTSQLWPFAPRLAGPVPALIAA